MGTTPAQAQRAALVQSVDEPGRNPHQDVLSVWGAGEMPQGPHLVGGTGESRSGGAEMMLAAYLVHVP